MTYVFNAENEAQAYGDIQELFPNLPILYGLGLEEVECISWRYYGPREVCFIHHPRGDRYMAPRHYYRYRFKAV